MLSEGQGRNVCCRAFGSYASALVRGRRKGRGGHVLDGRPFKTGKDIFDTNRFRGCQPWLRVVNTDSRQTWSMRRLLSHRSLHRQASDVRGRETPHHCSATLFRAAGIFMHCIVSLDPGDLTRLYAAYGPRGCPGMIPFFFFGCVY